RGEGGLEVVIQRRLGAIGQVNRGVGQLVEVLLRVVVREGDRLGRVDPGRAEVAERGGVGEAKPGVEVGGVLVPNREAVSGGGRAAVSGVGRAHRQQVSGRLGRDRGVGKTLDDEEAGQGGYSGYTRGDCTPPR